MGRTHLVLGIDSLWLLAGIRGAITPESFPILLGGVALGALLPDLDASESSIRSLKLGGIRPFVPLSVLLHRAFGHRGLLHAPLALVIVGAICVCVGILFSAPFALALWLGYASHLLADACTRSGIPLGFRPEPRLHLLPKRFRLLTGSPAEEVVWAGLAALALLLVMRRMLVPS